MEFLNSILVEVSRHKLGLLRLYSRFVWFSTLVFPFYKMIFMNRHEYSYFGDLLCIDCKTREEYGFL